MKLLCFLLIFAACSSYFPPIRGQYTLTSLKHFMVTNMYVNPSNLEKKDGEFFISYDIVVKNVDKKAHPIDLAKSKIHVAEKDFPMDCGRYKERDRSFSLETASQTRITCLARLEKNAFPRSDYRSLIEIPLDEDIAKFEYLLRAEDFQ